ncbi:hypothetical protein ACFQ1I_33890 [Kitasatospora arboriphila]
MLPRQAGQAYRLAREAERQGGGAADPAFQRANAVLVAGLGVLPAAELSAQQRRSPPPCRRGGAPGVRAVRPGLGVGRGGAAGRPAHPAAGVREGLRRGPDEDAALLGEVLAGCPGRPVPDALLDGAAALLAAHPPTDAVRAGLLEMFPPP